MRIGGVPRLTSGVRAERPPDADPGRGKLAPAAVGKPLLLRTTEGDDTCRHLMGIPNLVGDEIGEDIIGRQ
jgi:hypothetical protein